MSSISNGRNRDGESKEKGGGDVALTNRGDVAFDEPNRACNIQVAVDHIIIRIQCTVDHIIKIQCKVDHIMVDHIIMMWEFAALQVVIMEVARNVRL